MMSRFPAIGMRGRLAISIGLIMLAALAVTYLAVYRGTGNELRDRTEADIEREAERLAATLATSEADNPDEYRERARRLVRAESFGPSSRVVAITVDGGGTVSNQPELFGPSGDLGLIGKAEDDPEKNESGDDDKSEHESHHDDGKDLIEAPEGFSSLDVDDVGEVRLYSREVLLPEGNRATVRVGEPLAPVDRALEGLSDVFLLVGLGTLLLAVGAGWLLASSATKPMRKMAEIAEGVDGGELSARMPIDQTRNDEVRRLAESFNRMLGRLEDAFNRQRAFVADASHDLRTPLTIVKGQLEVLAREDDPDAEDVRRVTGLVTAATGRMERLVDDLLMLARAESGAALRLEATEAGPLVIAEVEGFSDTSDRNFEIGEISESNVRMDHESMARVVSNLLSNAVQHTSPGGRVAVSVTDQAGMVVIAVEDDGPGVPAELRDRIFDRFARLDSSRSSGSGGSGLGLAIVKALVEAQGGTVKCDQSTIGGAKFTVSMPRFPVQRESA